MLTKLHLFEQKNCKEFGAQETFLLSMLKDDA